MKCKKCGGNVIDIVEKQISIITPIGQNERPLGSVFIARCPNAVRSLHVIRRKKTLKQKAYKMFSNETLYRSVK